MIVVTAAGGSLADCAQYHPIIEQQARKCVEYRYRHRIYNLGNLGIGEFRAVPDSDFKLQVNGDSLPAATFKPSLVLESLKEAAQNELVMWMDADCLPIKEFMPPSELGGFDAAVTLRTAPEIGLSNNPALDYLNSGVVWIRNTPAGLRFCEQWKQLSATMKTDQGALNVCVAGYDADRTPFWWAELSRRLPGTVTYKHSPYVVLVLPCEEWNSWHLPPCPITRILHFKRGIRSAAKDYLNR